MDETGNYILEEIKHLDLISEKHKNTCKYSNYVEHLLILPSTIMLASKTGSLSVSAFAIIMCSCWSYKFCNTIKKLCNHCRNQKV